MLLCPSPLSSPITYRLSTPPGLPCRASPGVYHSCGLGPRNMSPTVIAARGPAIARRLAPLLARVGGWGPFSGTPSPGEWSARSSAGACKEGAGPQPRLRPTRSHFPRIASDGQRLGRKGACGGFARAPEQFQSRLFPSSGLRDRDFHPLRLSCPLVATRREWQCACPRFDLRLPSRPANLQSRPLPSTPPSPGLLSGLLFFASSLGHRSMPSSRHA
jgi:hypothetical protein